MTWTGHYVGKHPFQRSCPRFIHLFSRCNGHKGLLWWLSVKESACQYRSCEFNPWAGKIPWKRKWQPIPVFLPENSHGQKSLEGYSPWGRKEWNTTKQLSTGMRRLSLYHSLDWNASPGFPQDFFPLLLRRATSWLSFLPLFSAEASGNFFYKGIFHFVGYTISVATTQFHPCNAKLLLEKM